MRVLKRFRHRCSGAALQGCDDAGLKPCATRKNRVRVLVADDDRVGATLLWQQVDGYISRHTAARREIDLTGGVEHVAHLAGQRVRRERLLQERRALDENPVTDDRLVRVSRDVQHAQAGVPR